MENEIKFSNKELSFLSDVDILLTKRILQGKIYDLLVETQANITPIIKSVIDSIPANNRQAKISKGENYLNLPYMVLDYPAVFSKKDIFAYRTMFYWGNFFSTTLHLQGKYLEQLRQRLFDEASVLIESNIYISTGISPWHYHYKADNYIPLTQENRAKILNDPFIKLSLKNSTG